MRTVARTRRVAAAAGALAFAAPCGLHAQDGASAQEPRPAVVLRYVDGVGEDDEAGSRIRASGEPVELEVAVTFDAARYEALPAPGVPAPVGAGDAVWIGPVARNGSGWLPDGIEVARTQRTPEGALRMTVCGFPVGLFELGPLTVRLRPLEGGPEIEAVSGTLGLGVVSSLAEADPEAFEPVPFDAEAARRAAERVLAGSGSGFLPYLLAAVGVLGFVRFATSRRGAPGRARERIEAELVALERAAATAAGEAQIPARCADLVRSILQEVCGLAARARTTAELRADLRGLGEADGERLAERVADALEAADAARFDPEAGARGGDCVARVRALWTELGGRAGAAGVEAAGGGRRP